MADHHSVTHRVVGSYGDCKLCELLERISARPHKEQESAVAWFARVLDACDRPLETSFAPAPALDASAPIEERIASVARLRDYHINPIDFRDFADRADARVDRDDQGRERIVLLTHRGALQLTPNPNVDRGCWQEL